MPFHVRLFSWLMKTSSDRKRRKCKALAHIHTVEAILRRWDPIEVRPGEFAPADEYDSYAPHIVSMVIGGCSIGQLSQHLEHLRTRTMGVEANRKRDLRIAIDIVRALRTKAD
jgi:hypothetical protein